MRQWILIFIAIIIVGCSKEQSHNNLLAKAESIVFQHPDSVVGMLSKYWGDTTMTESDRALFGLIYTEALHRSGLLTESDSLILASRRYYEANGDEEHLTRAMLHHGIILYRQQQTHEAVLTMKRAEQMAENLNMPEFDWFLFSVLGDVNDDAANHSLTLRYYRQALAAAEKCSNNNWKVQSLNNIASTFDLLGSKDSLRHYLELTQKYADATNGEVKATYLVNKASYLLSTGRITEAKNCLKTSQGISPTDKGAKLFADIYIHEGDTTAAQLQWYRLTSSLSTDVATDSYHRLIELMNKRGDTAETLKYSMRLNELYRKLNGSNSATSVIALQTQYDEQLKEERQFRQTVALLAAIVLIVAMAFIAIRYGRQRISLLNERYAESRQQNDDMHSELTKIQQQNEREKRENSRQMKEVVSRLHATAYKGMVADNEDVNMLTQLSYAYSPELRTLLSSLTSKDQALCLLIRQNFLPTEIATLLISTPQAITNTRVRLLKKLFNKTGGAKEFDSTIKNYISE